jgi:FMN phosphatase YigB (HAD superfamily)
MQLEPARLTTIVFDVDGTLYRQGPLRRAMLLRLLRHAAWKPRAGWTTLRALRAYRHAQELRRDVPVDGGLAKAQLRLACERTGLDEEVVTSIVARWMDREPLPLLRRLVEPALRRFLDTARERGVRLGVLSDYPAHAKLEAMDLRSMFDVVVSAQDSDVNRFKPSPDGLVAALRRLDAAPEQALYVGDRPEVDACVARAVGVPCVIVGRREPARASADWISTRNYTDLHSLLFSPDTTS